MAKRKKYSCPCHICKGEERIAKTIRQHLGVAELSPGEGFGDWLASFRLEYGLTAGKWLTGPLPPRPRAPVAASSAVAAVNLPEAPSQTQGGPSEPAAAPVSSGDDDGNDGHQIDEDVVMNDDSNKSDASMEDPGTSVPAGATQTSPVPDQPAVGRSRTPSVHLDTLEDLDHLLPHVTPAPQSGDKDAPDEDVDPETLTTLRQQDEQRAAAVALEEETRNHQPFEGREDIDFAPSIIEAIENTRSYISHLQNATLDNGKLNKSTIENLKNPTPGKNKLTSQERLHLKLYAAHLKASQDTFNATQEAINEYDSSAGVPTFKAMEAQVRNITGITTIADNMCATGCFAYTGPNEDHQSCSTCGGMRYIETEKGQKVPYKNMITIPLAPQLAALKRDPESCRDLRWAVKETERIMKERETQQPSEYVYDDVYAGDDFLDFAQEVNLTDDDFIVGLSLDGAQLYQNKASDTWIGIWTVYNYDPKKRYKRKHILPAFIVPGPNKPKNIDSFTFRSLHHLSALQRHNNGEGIKMWDAEKQAMVNSRVFFLLQTADAPAMIYMDGRVGHHGAHGCRLGCPMKGRHDKGTGFYYAVHLKPYNYTVKGCDHPDVNLRAIFKPPTPEEYEKQVQYVMASTSQRVYEKRRLETGIGKPSILSGLSPRHTIALPKCFSVDLMHLLFINIADLIVPLWRGIPLKKGENTKDWGDWVCLTGDVWKQHGKLVGDATRYFPSSFHRPPRNPAEKINSGYKATEYYLYLFGLGVGFFRTVLPKKYWQHFCKLAKGVHIILQRVLESNDIRRAQKLFVEYVSEFEHLYFQRRPERLHFCRPWLHTLLHLPMEATRVGPGVYTTQFTMERAVGDYGGEVRQPGNPFGNLAKVMERQAHLNALKAMYPEVDRDNKGSTKAKRMKQDAGDGYTLLHPASRRPEQVQGRAGQTMQQQAGISTVTVWERIQLPNGQVVRSHRKESRLTKTEHRVTRNVKIFRNGAYQYAEVQHYFRCQPDPTNPLLWETKALVSLYTPPNPTLFEESCGTLLACRYTGEDGFAVIDVDEIVSLVAMIPLPILPEEVEYKNMFFPVEKSGLEDTELTGKI